MVNGQIQTGKFGAPTRRLVQQTVPSREVDQLAQADISGAEPQTSTNVQAALRVVNTEEDRLRAGINSAQSEVNRLAAIPNRSQGEEDTLRKNETNIAIGRQQISFLQNVKGSGELESRGGGIRNFLVRRLGSIASRQETAQSISIRRQKDPGRPFQGITDRPTTPKTAPPLLPPGSIGTGARGGFLFQEGGRVVERFETPSAQEEILQQTQLQQKFAEPGDIPNQSNIDFVRPAPKPTGVISPALTTREQFSKATAKGQLPIRGALFFIGEKFQGAITQSELRGRSQSLGATGLVSPSVQIAPFLIPATAPALALGFAVEQFTPAGIEEGLGTAKGIEEDFNINKHVAIAGVFGTAALVGFSGGRGTLGQVNRALALPRSEVTTLAISTKVRPTQPGPPKGRIIATDIEGRIIALPKPKPSITVELESTSLVKTKKSILSPSEIAVVKSTSKSIIKQDEFGQLITKGTGKGTILPLKSRQLPRGKVIPGRVRDFQTVTIGTGDRIELVADLVQQQGKVIKAVSQKLKGFTLRELTKVGEIERTTTAILGRGQKGIKTTKFLDVGEEAVVSEIVALESGDLLFTGTAGRLVKRTDKGLKTLRRGRQKGEQITTIKPPKVSEDILRFGAQQTFKKSSSNILKALTQQQSENIAKVVSITKPQKTFTAVRPLRTLGISKEKLLGTDFPTIVGGRGAPSQFAGQSVIGEVSLGPLSLGRPQDLERLGVQDRLLVAPRTLLGQPSKEISVLRDSTKQTQSQNQRERQLQRQNQRQLERLTQRVNQRQSQRSRTALRQRNILRERTITRSIAEPKIFIKGLSKIPFILPIIPIPKLDKRKKKKKARRGRDDIVISEGFTARILRFKPIVITDKNLQQELRRFRGIGTRPAPILRLGRNRRNSNGLT